MPPFNAFITVVTGISCVLFGYFLGSPKEGLIPYQWSHPSSLPTFIPESVPPQQPTLPPTEDFIPSPDFLQTPYCGYWEQDDSINVQPSNLSIDPVPGEYFVDAEGRVISCVASPWPESGWQMRWFKTQRWSRENLRPWLYLLLEPLAIVPYYICQLYALACAVMVTAFLCSQQASRVARISSIKLAVRDARIREEEGLKDAAQQNLEHTQGALAASTSEVAKLQMDLREQKEDSRKRHGSKDIEITNLKQQIGNLEKERDVALTANRKAGKERGALAAKSESQAEENHSLKQEVEDLTTKLNEMETELTSLRPIYATVLATNERLSAQISILEKDATVLVEQTEGDKKSQDQVKKLKANLNSKDTELTALKLTHVSMVAENGRLATRISKLENKDALSTKALNELRAQRDEQARAEAASRESVLELREKVKTLTEAASTQAASVESRVQELQEQVEKLTEAKRDEQAKTTSLTQECEILQAEKQRVGLSHAELSAQYEELQRQNQTATKPAVKPSENASTPQGPASGETSPVPNASEPQILNGVHSSVPAKEATALEPQKDKRHVTDVSVSEPATEATPRSAAFDRQFMPTPTPAEPGRTNQPQPLVTPKKAEVPVLDGSNRASPFTYSLKDYVSANPRPRVLTNVTKEYKCEAKLRQACWRCGGQGHNGGHCGIWKAQAAFQHLKDKYAAIPGGVAELERRILANVCFACGAADHSHKEEKCPSFPRSRSALNPAASTFDPPGTAASNPSATPSQATAPQHDPAPKTAPSGPRKLLEQLKDYPQVLEEELWSRINHNLCLYCGQGGHNDKTRTCPQRYASVSAAEPAFVPPQQQSFHLSMPGLSTSFPVDAAANYPQPVWNPFVGMNGASWAPQNTATVGNTPHANQTAIPFGASISEIVAPRAPTTAQEQTGTIISEQSKLSEKTDAVHEVKRKSQSVEPVQSPVSELGKSNSGPTAPPDDHRGLTRPITAVVPAALSVEKPSTPKKQLGGKPSKWANPDYLPWQTSKSGAVNASSSSIQLGHTSELAVKSSTANATPSDTPVKEVRSHTTSSSKPSPSAPTDRSDESKGLFQSAARVKGPTWKPDMSSKWARSTEESRNIPRSREEVAKSSPEKAKHASKAEIAMQPLAQPQITQAQLSSQPPGPSNASVPEANRGDSRRTEGRGRGRGQNAGCGRGPAAAQGGIDRTAWLEELASKNAASENQAFAESEARVRAMDEQKRRDGRHN